MAVPLEERILKQKQKLDTAPLGAEQSVTFSELFEDEVYDYYAYNVICYQCLISNSRPGLLCFLDATCRIMEERPQDIFYLEWLINNSPFADVFLEKDPLNMLFHPVSINTELPTKHVVSALIAARYIKERKNIVSSFYKYVSLGADPIKAWLFAHFHFIGRDTEFYSQFNLSAITGHDVLSTYVENLGRVAFTKHIKKFINNDRSCWTGNYLSLFKDNQNYASTSNGSFSYWADLKDTSKNSVSSVEWPSTAKSYEWGSSYQAHKIEDVLGHINNWCEKNFND